MFCGWPKLPFRKYSCFLELILVSFLFVAIWIGNFAIKHVEFKQHMRLLESRKTLFEEMESYNKEHRKFEVKRLPAMIGIGVKKCGTDGILSFLQHHPLIKIPPGQETVFFPGRTQIDKEKYKKTMPPTNDRQLAIEKTPIYYTAPPYTMPHVISQTVPGVKLFMVVCDPTTRAYSDYIHERVRFELFHDPLIKDFDTFEKFVEHYLPQVQRLTEGWNASDPSLEQSRQLLNFYSKSQAATLISNGIYAAHFKRWKEVFNESNLLLINGNRFLEDPGTEIERLQDYLGIPKMLLKEDFVRRPDTGFFCYRQKKSSDYTMATKSSEEEFIKSLKCLNEHKGRTRNGKRKAKPGTLEKLRNFYEPFNQAFYRLSGVDFRRERTKA